MLPPILISEALLKPRSPHAALVLEHAHWFATHPDPTSEFARKRWARLLPWAPKWLLFALLIRQNYDGMVYVTEATGEVLGHVIWQRHGNNLHVFSVHVHNLYRHQGLALEFLEDFVHVAHVNNCHAVRIGQDNNPDMCSLRKRLLTEGLVPFKLIDRGKGWIIIDFISALP